ncbi:hypothetical protein [Massilia sp. DWR3-1-1]|uniref:hypothetical protein n=1 Tax=Massilia sp. DWR3-1-1 TaxID=2804559 RepID=UPI003CF51009
MRAKPPEGAGARQPCAPSAPFYLLLAAMVVLYLGAVEGARRLFYRSAAGRGV